jgi:NAD(P)-dependent dehydrogenase (short-subunit alcohol dehydrogenase family)
VKLKGKVALITGAGRGIGKAIAMRFAEEGARIAVNDINFPSAVETAGSIIQKGGKAIPIKADVAETLEVNAMVEKVINDFGSIDILVNNAGIVANDQTGEKAEETWLRVTKVNLGGTYLCSRKVGQWMTVHGGGKILSISSATAIKGSPEVDCYGPSKAAIISLTRMLAVEWGKSNIRVNCIAPSTVRTPLAEEGLKKGAIKMEDIQKQTPLGRIAEPEEIVEAALFLVSDDSSYITGITLPVDGGYLAYGYQTV